MVDEKKFGNNLIKDFLKLFDEHSIRNPAYARMILHVILGQALKNIYFRQGARRIDIRIHLLLIRPSGAGKGAGYGFFHGLASDLGMDNQMLTEATDAGLAGSGGMNPRTGDIEINEGLMVNADFISMEEGSTLFDYTSSFSKKNLTYLQIAMNPLADASCEISKKIGSIEDAIRFKPHCSFLILTYMPERFINALITRGVIQRFVTIIQAVTLDERLKVVDIGIDKLNISTEDDFDEKYQSVLARIKYVINKYQKRGIPPATTRYNLNKDVLTAGLNRAVGRKLDNDIIEKLTSSVEKTVDRLNNPDWSGYCFDISDKSKEEIRVVEHELMNMINDTTPVAQEKLQEFTHRVLEQLIRFSIHHAILDLRESVETQDVVYARQVMLPIWQNVIYNLEDMLVAEREQRIRINMVISGAVDMYHAMLTENNPKFVRKDNVGSIWVRRATLIKRLQPKWDNCSFITANNRVMRLETDKKGDTNKNKWFQRKKFGSTLFVKLLQDIK